MGKTEVRACWRCGAQQVGGGACTHCGAGPEPGQAFAADPRRAFRQDPRRR